MPHAQGWRFRATPLCGLAGAPHEAKKPHRTDALVSNRSFYGTYKLQAWHLPPFNTHSYQAKLWPPPSIQAPSPEPNPKARCNLPIRVPSSHSVDTLARLAHRRLHLHHAPTKVDDRPHEQAINALATWRPGRQPPQVGAQLHEV